MRVGAKRLALGEPEGVAVGSGEVGRAVEAAVVTIALAAAPEEAERGS